MSFSIYEYATWLLGPSFHFVLLVVIWKRRLASTLSPFIAYLFYGPCVSLVLVFASRSRLVYNLSYHAFGLLQYPLQVAVLWLLIKRSARSHNKQFLGLPRVVKIAGALLIVLSIAIALGSGGTLHPSNFQGQLDLLELRVSIFSSLLMCGLVVCFFVVAERLALKLNWAVFAIAQGFFSWAYFGLIVDVTQAFLGVGRWSQGLHSANALAYILVLVYWILALHKGPVFRSSVTCDDLQSMTALHRAIQADSERIEDAL